MREGDKITPTKRYTFRHPYLPDNTPVIGKIYYVDKVFDDGMILITGLVGLWDSRNFKVL